MRMDVIAGGTLINVSVTCKVDVLVTDTSRVPVAPEIPAC